MRYRAAIQTGGHRLFSTERLSWSAICTAEDIHAGMHNQRVVEASQTPGQSDYLLGDQAVQTTTTI
jgi:hypothetical protein